MPDLTYLAPEMRSRRAAQRAARGALRQANALTVSLQVAALCGPTGRNVPRGTPLLRLEQARDCGAEIALLADIETTPAAANRMLAEFADASRRAAAAPHSPGGVSRPHSPEGTL